MKNPVLFLFFSLVVLSQAHASPENEISSLCNFHLEYAKTYNPGKFDRMTGAKSYPGEEKFQECVERGLGSYQGGMLKVFKDICTVLPKNPNSDNVGLSLAAIRYSRDCRNSLLVTKVPDKEEFVKVETECKKLAGRINEETSGIVAGESFREQLKVVIENNCILQNKRFH